MLRVPPGDFKADIRPNLMLIPYIANWSCCPDKAISWLHVFHISHGNHEQSARSIQINELVKCQTSEITMWPVFKLGIMCLALQMRGCFSGLCKINYSTSHSNSSARHTKAGLVINLFAVCYFPCTCCYISLFIGIYCFISVSMPSLSPQNHSSQGHRVKPLEKLYHVFFKNTHHSCKECQNSY